jgi:Icc-related predicted phosphoesterase
MKILAVSDTEIGFIYSPMVRERFENVDLIVSCGDLPYYYLEYIISMLNIPLYFVRGNHASKIEFSSSGVSRSSPWGAIDLHERVFEDDTGLLLAGLEGSINYNQGPHQYTQTEFWLKAFKLVPRFLVNKALLGRYLDVLVTHAPPWGIHDMEDRPHHGIKAFNWLIKVFQPQVLLHGHIHLYRQDTLRHTRVGKTMVTNVYGYQEIEVETPKKRSWT